MGAKYSLGKKELDDGGEGEVPGSPHQDQQSDDGITSGSQGKYKITSVQNSKDNGDERTFNATSKDEHLSNKNTTGSSLEAIVASMATAVQNAKSSDSSNINKRYHPYDEVTDDQLAINQKIIHENNEEKSKKKGSPMLKIGKKTKEKKESESGKKQQKEAAAAKENIPNESELKQAVSHGHPKPAPRCHTYDEISDEQLVSNREAKNSENDKKLKTKDKSEEKVKKHKQQVTTNLELEINKKVLNSETKLKSGSESPNINRYHPYDEITEEELFSNRKALNEKKGGKLNEHSKKQADVKEKVIVHSEPTEYLNVAAIVASATASHGSEHCHSGKQEDEQDDLKDMYAVPHKKQPKANPTKQLNYIEVQFNPHSTKPEVKEPYTATTYSNVVVKDGVLVLES